MSEVLFYHLSESTLETVLPPLLERSLQRGWRAVVQFGSSERRDVFNALLWTFREDSFIGHGTDEEKHAELQPVFLTASDCNPNGAAIRFLVDGAVAPPLHGYERAVVIFDGLDADQLEAARGEWRRLKAEGHDVTYWQQTADGRWERKA